MFTACALPLLLCPWSDPLKPYLEYCRFDGHGTFTVAGTAMYMAPEVMQAGDLAADTSQLGTAAAKVGAAADPSSIHVADGQQGAGNRSGLGAKKRSAQRLDPKRGGYGKRADIWSVGVTLCEMALGRAPFANAGAAIFAVCVSKKFPTFPDAFSEDAHIFLGR